MNSNGIEWLFYSIYIVCICSIVSIVWTDSYIGSFLLEKDIIDEGGLEMIRNDGVIQVVSFG